MHEHLTDVFIEFDGFDDVKAERVFEQLHALQTLTFKVLKEL